MGYLHIENLYKCPDILLLKECYALEKIHGTSAHIKWKDGLHFFSGGEKHSNFVALFDDQKLKEAFMVIGCNEVTVYGEAYGGSCQGMSKTYGKQLKFVVFDVQIDGSWLAVPQAEEVTKSLGLEFVHYWKTCTEVEQLNACRDMDSEQSKRNGIEEPRKMEGVVLRPLIELRKNNGDRVMAKHKRDDYQERKTPHPIGEALLKVIEDANAIADEWVTEMRLTHVVDKLSEGGKILGIENTPDIMKAMYEDVAREAKGEILESKEARKAISKRAAQLFKKRIQTVCV